METCFEVETVLTEKMLREYLNKGAFKRWKIYGVIFLAFAVAMLVISTITHATVFATSVLGLTGIGGVFLLLPVLYAKWYIKGLRKFGDGKVSASITSFGDVIRDETPATVVTIPYEKVKKIHFLDTIIVIEDVKRTSIIFSKHNFIKGDLESFCSFIREKCPQLNLPQWQW